MIGWQLDDWQWLKLDPSVEPAPEPALHDPACDALAELSKTVGPLAACRVMFGGTP